MKIKTQLRLTFVLLLFFPLALGIVSFFQSVKLKKQVQLIYEHPFQVRHSLDNLKADVLSIRVLLNELFLTSDEPGFNHSLKKFEQLQGDAKRKLEVLYNEYLGPVSDIDSVNHALDTWLWGAGETIRHFSNGEIQEAMQHHRSFDIESPQVIRLMTTIDRVNLFTDQKAKETINDTHSLNRKFYVRVFILIFSSLIFLLILFFMLYKNISAPLEEIERVTDGFIRGGMASRVSYQSENEFGTLATSFNLLANQIQNNIELKERIAGINRKMIVVTEIVPFFRSLLQELLTNTNSQIAAVYLLSKDKKNFEYFDSIGLDNESIKSFNATNPEGEFGATLVSRKIELIKQIPKNTSFIFKTVSGKFIPREIVTIPVIAEETVIGIISLASVRAYKKSALDFVADIHDILNARVNGILDFRKIKEFSEKLATQNNKLTTQNNELEVQANELAQQNSELEVQKRQLEEASRMKTIFLSNMSHELRTPLNSVIALSGVLSHRLAGKISDDEFSYIEVIERNGKHLLSLINDILDLSRIEVGREKVELSEFDMVQLTNEIVELIQPLAEEKKIQLSVVNSLRGKLFYSDRKKCRHILQNVVGNAVKFTEKGKVEVIILQNNNGVVITVTDTGIGISKQDLPYIFDEFRQADGTTSRQFDGSGLGLAIAKKYARLLGGTISVESTLGKGSVFTISLPVSEKFYDLQDAEGVGFNNPVSENHKREFLKVVPAGKTVLVVDDNEPVIIQLKDILDEYDLNVLVAGNGREALEIVSKV
ncbi:MAG: MCP four helix bundle domain-containing protein, partial [Prolixibacteraceae bacterium]|nr:MCP four helix bundle domain-containing protein [Prolixibacteraceae bacterium]